MSKKITLETISVQLTSMDGRIARMDERMEKGFGAIADDIADVRRELKSDIMRVQEQVSAIETDLRGMKRDKLVTRVADLEEEVFGKARA